MVEGTACDLIGQNGYAVRTTNRAGFGFPVEARIRLDRLSITVVSGLVSAAIIN
jgi:ribosomal protein L37E